MSRFGMMGRLKIGGFSFFSFLLFAMSIPSLGQIPSSDFSAPAQACLSGTILLRNAGTSVESEWDLCQGDLLSNGPISVASVILPPSLPIGQTLIEVNHLWYGFMCDRSGMKLFRLDFGSSLINQNPVINDLGNPGGNLTGPQNIKIAEYQGNFYGFVNNYLANQLVRINFGNNIENSGPTSEVLSTASGFGNGGMDVAYDGNNWVVALSNSNTITLFNLGASPGTIAASITSMTTPAIPGVSDIGDIKFALDNNVWYGFIAGYSSNTVHRLTFGASLYTNPITQLLTVSVGSLLLYGLDIHQDNSNWVIFLVTLQGNLLRLNLGNQITNDAPQVVDLGRFAQLVNTLKLSMAHSKSRWLALTTRYDAQTFFLIDFPQSSCSFDKTYSYNTDTVLLKSVSSGPKAITHYVKDANGLMSSTTKNLNVLNTVAPSIDFTNSVCFGVPVSFGITSNGSLNSVAWDFNNDGVVDATAANTTYSFASLGQHYIYAKIIDNSGCENQIVKSITLYSPPTANFSLPVPAIICTNQAYTATNTSTFDPGSNPTWEWRLNGSLVSTQNNYDALFAATGSQEVRLKALINGCQNETIQTVSGVLAGPVVAFSANDNCLGNQVLFNNTTVGAIGFSWDFGDGSALTNTASPTHNYALASTYQVTLTSNSANGCQNSQTKGIKIYSLPQPDFSIQLPPFSCNNSPTPFQNNTPSLADSNITGWSWKFGDSQNGTSNQQSPAYTYTSAGSFTAFLTATSDAGCSGTISKSISISTAPSADFNMSSACVNQPTKFTDLSTGAVTARSWQIGSASFSSANPTYTFTTAGDFGATLTVSAANGCSNTKSKPLTVPVSPALAFSVSNPCAGKNAVFTDQTISPADAVAAWNWNFAGNSFSGNPASYNFATSGTNNVKMTTSHASGCKYTLSKNIVINPTPLVGFTASPDRGAAPLTVQFTNTSQQATTFGWKFYDKVTTSSSGISPIYTFTTLGDYSAELTATNVQGCSDVMTMPIKVLVPSIDLIMKDFSLSNDPVTGKLKCVVTILNNSNIPINEAEVALFLADKAVVNETLALKLNPGEFVSVHLSFSISLNQFDFNFLCAEVLNEKDTQTDNNKRCINMESSDYFFCPYPNPSSGTLHLDWITLKVGSARIRVVDGMGRLMYEWETKSQTGLNQAVINLEFLATGLYYVTVETNVGRKTMRFLRL